MRSQQHNQGFLKTLSVKLEADVVDSFKTMASNTGIPINDLVVIALKRFRSSHSDYLEKDQRKKP